MNAENAECSYEHKICFLHVTLSGVSIKNVRMTYLLLMLTFNND